MDGGEGDARSTSSARARRSATGAETLAVACPFCTVMLDDGVRQTGGGDARGRRPTLLVEARSTDDRRSRARRPRLSGSRAVARVLSSGLRLARASRAAVPSVDGEQRRADPLPCAFRSSRLRRGGGGGRACARASGRRLTRAGVRSSPRTGRRPSRASRSRRRAPSILATRGSLPTTGADILPPPRLAAAAPPDSIVTTLFPDLASFARRRVAMPRGRRRASQPSRFDAARRLSLTNPLWNAVPPCEMATRPAPRRSTARRSCSSAWSRAREPLAVGELAEARRPAEEHDLAARRGARAPGARAAAGDRGRLPPGPVLLRFAQRDVSARPSSSSRRRALARLAAASGETINLGVPTPLGVEHLAQEDSRALRRRDELGRPPGAVRARPRTARSSSRSTPRRAPPDGCAARSARAATRPPSTSSSSGSPRSPHPSSAPTATRRRALDLRARPSG